MKLEESTVLTVLHSFLKTSKLWTCYPDEDHKNFFRFLRRSHNVDYALSGKTPSAGINAASIKSPVLFYQKDFQN